MSGESKKKTLLDLTEDDFKSLLSSAFSEALSKLNQREKEEPKAKESEASELTVREIVEHALNCPNCGKPLRDFLENRFSKFKEELLKEVSEIARKKEERRGGLFE
jgi:transcription initiation factor IIE alpha subunit